MDQPLATLAQISLSLFRTGLTRAELQCPFQAPTGQSGLDSGFIPARTRGLGLARAVRGLALVSLFQLGVDW